MPTQYTATGVGSAIPVSELGEWITYTTTIPGTTRPPTTVAAHVLAASMVSGTTIQPATTVPAETFAGTTAAPKTNTFTSRIASTTAHSGKATPDFEAFSLGTGVTIILTALVIIHLLL